MSLQMYRTHRTRHSFPTRRSSDLARLYEPERPVTVCTVPLSLTSKAMLVTLPAPSGVMRSEEHTSELQSHHDLVCRLLLDKKKQPDVQREVPRNLPVVFEVKIPVV